MRPAGYTDPVIEPGWNDHGLQAFLFADPAAHSLSPRMHAAAFRHAGLKGTYEARRVRADELPAALEELRAPGVLGANLSLPHKEAAVQWLDDLTPAARAIGAVNTVVNRQGYLIGDNTDAPGLRDALGELGVESGDGTGPDPVVVLGAGGAARAAVYALLCLERNVIIVNRTHERAAELATMQGSGETRAKAAHLHDIPWPAVALIINASSAGLDAPNDTPLPGFTFGLLPPNALIYDMVYKPAETRLMREARAAGLRAENGLGMLAHQARRAFVAWTGQDVPAEVFIGALQGTFMEVSGR